MSAPSRIDRIQAMLADDPNDTLLRYMLAIEFRAAGNLAGSRETFADLLQRDPHYVPTYLQLGQLLAQLGEEEKAAQVLRDGIAVANKAGDQHAAGEMAGLLATL